MKRFMAIACIVLLASFGVAQTIDENRVFLINQLDKNLAMAKADYANLQSKTDALTLFTILGFMLAIVLFGIIWWKKSFMVGALYCRAKNWRLAEVKYFRPSLRQYLTFFSRDPKYGKFGPQDNFAKKIFDPIPDEIFEKKMSDTPFVSQQNLNVYREFHEESNEEVDPSSRTPLRIMDFSEIADYGLRQYRLGVSRGAMGNDRKVQVILLVAMLILGVGLLVTMNAVNEVKTQGEETQKTISSYGPVLKDMNTVLGNVKEVQPIKPGGIIQANVAGSVQ